jgi:hypothetical protein
MEELRTTDPEPDNFAMRHSSQFVSPGLWDHNVIFRELFERANSRPNIGG